MSKLKVLLIVLALVPWTGIVAGVAWLFYPHETELQGMKSFADAQLLIERERGCVPPKLFWRCDTPELRLWVYSHVPEVQFCYEYDEHREVTGEF